MTESTSPPNHATRMRDQETCTKACVVDKLYQQIGLSKRESALFVDQFLSAIAETLAQGQGVKLSSFGSFAVQHRKARVGRNPRTKETHPIPARRAVAFRASGMLKSKINKNGLAKGTARQTGTKQENTRPDAQSHSAQSHS